MNEPHTLSWKNDNILYIGWQGTKFVFRKNDTFFESINKRCSDTKIFVFPIKHRFVIPSDSNKQPLKFIEDFENELDMLGHKYISCIGEFKGNYHPGYIIPYSFDNKTTFKSKNDYLKFCTDLFKKFYVGRFTIESINDDGLIFDYFTDNYEYAEYDEVDLFYNCYSSKYNLIENYKDIGTVYNVNKSFNLYPFKRCDQ